MKADFSKIIRESIRITKSNKRLWVLGLVVASISAGGNFGSGGNFGDLGKQLEKPNQENNVQLDSNSSYKFKDNLDTPERRTNNLLNSNLLTSAEQLPQILGASTNSLMGLLKLIPFSFFVALGLLLTIAILLGIAVSFYAQSWAQSGLIAGINLQSAGENPSLYQMSDKGKLNAVQVIKIRLFPGLVFALLVIFSGLILAIPALALDSEGRVLTIALGIPYVVLVIIASIVVSASIHLGVLAVNLESLDWKAGFKRGFTIFKKFFLDVLIMSIINCFTGCVFGLAGLIVIAILIVIGGAAVLGVTAFPPFLVVAGPIIFLALLALIFVMGLLGAISAVFKQSTWVLLYKQLTEEAHGVN